MAPRVLLIAKPSCHLCDDARAVVAGVCADLGIEWHEQSVLDDPILFDEYWERIPVVVVDGRILDFWRIDATELRTRLTE